jgi:aldose 1-epimerase
MIFKHKIEPFGNFEKHTLENENGDAIVMVPQYGACLLDLRFGGVSVLDGYKTSEELVENAWSKNIVLFPYPNRLRDGRYTHGGKTYQFDINNKDSQNAIHGFGKDAPMVVKTVKITDDEAMILCTWQHDGSHPAYPFRFKVGIKMILRGGEFEMKMAFHNDDNQLIPVGLGWHPYFIMSENVSDTHLQMPESQQIVIDDRMLPTGEKIPFSSFDTLTKIGNTSLDNGFFITEKGDKASVILSSERGRLHYWQEIGAGKWNFLQVFTPPHRKSIAIEPMTCNIDAFNNQDGLVWLAPKAKLDGSFGVKFSKFAQV